MKILLTTIILALGIFTSVMLTQHYHRAPMMNKQSLLEVKPIKPKSLETKSVSLAVKPIVTLKPSLPKPLPEKKQNKPVIVNHVSTHTESNSKISNVEVDKLISTASSQGLKPKVLKSALNAYYWAYNHKKLGNNKDILTVIDFTLPSYQKRMWVLNLHQHKILMKLYTTQGSGSGLVYASRFSNRARTHETSLGLYVTSEEYYGKHGKSMRLDGLQHGINDNARSRSIVLHSAAYASPSFIKANHRAGRSWGCFAVSSENKPALLHYVKGGSAFFAYAHPLDHNQIVSHGPLAV